MWESDAQRMREVGIEYVRIGEFMWEIIEPSFSQFNWTILDSVLQIFANHGLKAVCVKKKCKIWPRFSERPLQHHRNG